MFLRERIRDKFLADETKTVEELLSFLKKESIDISQAQKQSADFIDYIKTQSTKKIGIENFLKLYPLTSKEGLGLMILCECYLRIPDSHTQQLILEDKLVDKNWSDYLGKSDKLATKASVVALIIAEALLAYDTENKNPIERVMGKLSSPIIRKAFKKSLMFVGNQFILGETIEDAIKKGSKFSKKDHQFSFDMLGEAAVTEKDVQRYFKAYKNAILVPPPGNGQTPFDYPGVSIKLSALYPKYEDTHQDAVIQNLYPLVLELCLLAKQKNVLITIDAEEAERLELSLDLIEYLFLHPELKTWKGLGFALQAYQKRAFSVLDWARDLSQKAGKPFYIRLVKGAYWDNEIKKSQERGLSSFPVFTQKNNTEISYLACALKILKQPENFLPQFATHNPFTFSLLEPFFHEHVEMQRLQGMGESFFEKLPQHLSKRIYAPIGGHKDLLAYLIRRLLENGANTSFVQNILDENIPLSKLLANPFDFYNDHPMENIMIPTASKIYSKRYNSEGFDLSDRKKVEEILETLNKNLEDVYQGASLIKGQEVKNKAPQKMFSPCDQKLEIGEVYFAEEKDLYEALDSAYDYYLNWEKTDVETRAKHIEALGAKLEKNAVILYELLIKEAGKTLPDAVSEVREAVDFCYYYAQEARRILSCPESLEGPTGEINELSLHPRGVFLCIAPWNFPLAIFLGQMIAALVTGNTVLAKPATQTSLIATYVVKLAHEIGIPKEALHLVIAPGSLVGKTVIKDQRLAGVVFTGSTETAHQIQKTLASRQGPILPFIAETGGINAMFVDSSALLEQVTKDVLTSAFKSAGQRCSALRLLVVQEDIYKPLLEMIQGAMEFLSVGESWKIETDVGPVIDEPSKTSIETYIHEMAYKGFAVFQKTISSSQGFCLFPALIEVEKVSDVSREIFGPVLHITSFKKGHLTEAVQEVNRLGYGLTMGLHTRIESTIDDVRQNAKVGNLYVNRNIIGAVVGTQPFGGEGLSGTGFKAGGPYYLLKFLTERTFTHDITATGGNISLLNGIT